MLGATVRCWARPSVLGMGSCWFLLSLLCGFAGSAVFEKGGCISQGAGDCARRPHRCASFEKGGSITQISPIGGWLPLSAHAKCSMRLRGGADDGPAPMEVDDDAVPTEVDEPTPPGETKSGLRKRPPAPGIPGSNPSLLGRFGDLLGTGPSKRAVRIKWKTRTFDVEIDVTEPTAVLKEKICNITQVQPRPKPAPSSSSLLSRRSQWTLCPSG